jgi:hypothetical protein
VVFVFVRVYSVLHKYENCGEPLASTLQKMGVAGSSQTLTLFFQTAWCVAEDSSLRVLLLCFIRFAEYCK